MVCKSSSAQLVDLDELIEANLPVQNATNDGHPHMTTIILRNKIQPLVSVKTLNGFLMLIPTVHPPHALIKAKNNFQVLSL